jgi:hypothetical protein
VAETLTESIRRRVREKSGECPTCHQPTAEGGVRQVAQDIGLSHTTLWRFMRGHQATSDVLDKIVTWLDAPQ